MINFCCSLYKRYVPWVFQPPYIDWKGHCWLLRRILDWFFTLLFIFPKVPFLFAFILFYKNCLFLFFSSFFFFFFYSYCIFTVKSSGQLEYLSLQLPCKVGSAESDWCLRSSGKCHDYVGGLSPCFPCSVQYCLSVSKLKLEICFLK